MAVHLKGLTGCCCLGGSAAPVHLCLCVPAGSDDYYSILGVPPDADSPTIRRAYLTLMKVSCLSSWVRAQQVDLVSSRPPRRAAIRTSAAAAACLPSRIRRTA